jgi:N-acetylmuramoyl-L-alanine amidase
MKKRTTFGALAALLSLCVIAQAGNVILVRDDDRGPASIAADEQGGVVYVSVKDVARALELTTKWLPTGEKLLVGQSRYQAKFTAWNPVVTIDEIPYNMPARTLLKGGTLLAPAGSVARLLDPFIAGTLSWDARNKIFRTSKTSYNIVAGNVEQRENGTLVTLSVRGDLIIEERTSDPNWLNLVIIGGRADTWSFNKLALRGAALQIIAYQYRTSAQVSIRLEPDHTYRLNRNEESGQVLIMIRPVKPLPSPLTGLGDVVRADRDKWAINTVVIDPGHGGKDPGCVGWDNIYEKDIVLPIALQLADRLRDDLGVHVVLTRDTDRYTSLRTRGRKAINEGGKLFVSIHCNWLKQTWFSGVETYFLSDALTDEARRVARLENASLRFEVDTTGVAADSCCDWGDVEEIMVGMSSTHYLKESQQLAKGVQEELVRSLGTRDLGVHQANFYVMRGTLGAMPSIMVEVGYLSNPAEARRLRQKSYQRRVADAIYLAISEFKRARERGM